MHSWRAKETRGTKTRERRPAREMNPWNHQLRFSSRLKPDWRCFVELGGWCLELSFGVFNALLKSRFPAPFPLMTGPLVSIIMRSFNEGWALGDTLPALNRQDYKSWELIVIDSGSTDGSVDLIRAAKPRHFIQIRSEEYNPS